MAISKDEKNLSRVLDFLEQHFEIVIAPPAILDYSPWASDVLAKLARLVIEEEQKYERSIS